MNIAPMNYKPNWGPESTCEACVISRKGVRRQARLLALRTVKMIALQLKRVLEKRAGK